MAAAEYRCCRHRRRRRRRCRHPPSANVDHGDDPITAQRTFRALVAVGRITSIRSGVRPKHCASRALVDGALQCARVRCNGDARASRRENTQKKKQLAGYERRAQKRAFPRAASNQAAARALLFSSFSSLILPILQLAAATDAAAAAWAPQKRATRI